MKYYLLVGLCLALVGCGGEERIAELTSQVAALKSERDKLAAEKVAMKDNLQTIALGPIMEEGQRMLGQEYPDNKVAGFALARASIVRVGQLAEVFSAGGVDVTAQVVSPLYTMESSWPHRLSDSGMKIVEPLWWCRDAVVITRLQVEAMRDQQNADARLLFDAAKSARMKCHLALATISQKQREEASIKSE
jgi:hypothetical protein